MELIVRQSGPKSRLEAEDHLGAGVVRAGADSHVEVRRQAETAGTGCSGTEEEVAADGEPVVIAGAADDFVQVASRPTRDVRERETEGDSSEQLVAGIELPFQQYPTGSQ